MQQQMMSNPAQMMQMINTLRQTNPQGAQMMVQQMMMFGQGML
jgi:hypothetical protein